MKIAHFLLIVLLLFIGTCCYSQTASRLVGFSLFRGTDTTGPCWDSGIYNKYSMDRGGEMYPIPSKFSYGYLMLNSYPFNPSAHDCVSNNPGVTKFDSAWKINPYGTLLSEQFFDEKDNITYARKRLLIGDSLRNVRSMSYKYNTYNHLVEEIDTIWSNYGSYGVSSVTFYQFVYDMSQNLISSVTYSIQENDTTTKSGLAYFYDGNRNLIAVCEQSWNETVRSMLTNRITRLYYTGNKPDSFHIDDVFYFKNDTIPYVAGKYHFSSLDDTIIVSHYFLSYTLSYPGILYHRTTNLYDVHHNKTSMTMENLDSFVSNYTPDRFEYTYNNFNQVTSEKYYAMDVTGTFNLTWLYRYYYETYNPGPPYQVNEMDIYPCPTKGDLTLKMLLHDAQPFAVCIYNSVGQKIMQWDEPAIKEYKKTISLPELASGNYFLRVLIGKQRIVKKFMVN